MVSRDRDPLNLGEAFELARQAIQALMLINGGGAVAVLAFFGNLLTAANPPKNPPISQPYVLLALLTFALGLVLGTVTSLVGYRVQARWGQEIKDPATDLDAFDAFTERLTYMAVWLGLCSLFAFVIGAGLAALALLGAPPRLTIAASADLVAVCALVAVLTAVLVTRAARTRFWPNLGLALALWVGPPVAIGAVGAILGLIGWGLYRLV